MKKRKRSRVDVNIEELDSIVDAAQEKPLTREEGEKLKSAIHLLAAQIVPEHPNSEKKDDVFGDGRPDKPGRPRAAGHGRNPASAFTGAEQVQVPHETLNSGCGCPECEKGKLYPFKEPRPLIRFVGQMPFKARVYQLERLRCNLCGELYTAQEPEGVGPEKYDESVTAVLGVMRYGMGVPHHRMESMQKQIGVPLPAGTQCDLIADGAELLEPIHAELVRQAAQSEVIHTDDTSMPILQITRDADDERTGVFTTGVVAVDPEHKIAFYVTGKQHAGENLDDLLEQREEGAEPVIHMGDALSRNKPKKRMSEGVEILFANCLTHGRRHFVEVADHFPDQCRHVLELLGEVYANDDWARQEKLNPKERLVLHQSRSFPLMKSLHAWCESELKEKRVEPNSGLGKAIKYLLTHWRGLTQFLRVAGSPLDNNICERALKKAVLHRKNSLFFRTPAGAHRGDIFMTLIHTCELNGISPYDYLLQLLKHAGQVQDEPCAWVPWKYQQTLTELSPASG